MKFLEILKINPSSPLRLFCFPYGGSGASIFFPWEKEFGHLLELVAIQLPGRETRFNEQPLLNIAEVKQGIVNELKSLSDKPMIFFGHSIGGLISYEVTKELIHLNLPIPQHLIVSGCKAPHILPRRVPIHSLPDAEFIEALKLYNSIPKQFFEEYEMLKIFLPTIRADFTISENYKFAPHKAFPINITALSGIQDPTVNVCEIEPWRCHTDKQFDHIKLPGDHFFFKTSDTLIYNIINRIINNYL